MAELIATNAWQSVTLSADEKWQSQADAIYVTTDASPGMNDGQNLKAGIAETFSSGDTVSYRHSGIGDGLIDRREV